jgi:hypothetical protein
MEGSPRSAVVNQPRITRIERTFASPRMRLGVLNCAACARNVEIARKMRSKIKTDCKNFRLGKRRRASYRRRDCGRVVPCLFSRIATRGAACNA